MSNKRYLDNRLGVGENLLLRQRSHLPDLFNLLSTNTRKQKQHHYLCNIYQTTCATYCQKGSPWCTKKCHLSNANDAGTSFFSAWFHHFCLFCLSENSQPFMQLKQAVAMFMEKKNVEGLVLNSKLAPILFPNKTTVRTKNTEGKLLVWRELVMFRWWQSRNVIGMAHRQSKLQAEAAILVLLTCVFKTRSARNTSQMWTYLSIRLIKIFFFGGGVSLQCQIITWVVLFVLRTCVRVQTGFALQIRQGLRPSCTTSQKWLARNAP